MQSQRTKEIYWGQNYQGTEGVSIGQKYQQRNVFTSNGDGHEKLAVSKFQKRSFQITCQISFQ